MALVSAGFEMHVVLTDSSGVDKAKLLYKFNEGTVYADAITNGATIRTRLLAITDAVISSYSVIERFVEAALALPANVEIENRAVIVARINNDPTKTANILVPAPKIGIFQNATGSGRNKIDVVDSDLLTYLGSFQATGGFATLSDGEQLDDTNVIVDGKRTHRKSSDG